MKTQVLVMSGQLLKTVGSTVWPDSTARGYHVGQVKSDTTWKAQCPDERYLRSLLETNHALEEDRRMLLCIWC